MFRFDFSRRELIQSAAASLAAAGLHAQTPPPAASKPVMCLFSKPLRNRAVKDLPAALNKLEINALDLTCRGGGHVLPERVVDDLPRAHEQLKAAGISIAMLTTEITDAGKGNAEAIVKTAASLGIRCAKLGYYGYGDLDRIPQTLADVKAKLRDIAALFRQHGVRAGYHNHSGTRVGAPLWDLHQLIADLPPDAIGSYFDFGHATVEGGDGAWKVNLGLLLPRIIMVAAKDVRWEKGDRGWRPRWGPLGEGMVRWSEGFDRLRQARFAGPISLHVEYGDGGAAGSAEDAALLASIGKDWAFLRDRLRAAGLA